MRRSKLRWIPLTFVLGLVIVLDPTHTPAQFGGKGGGFGGKGGGGGMDPESRWQFYQQQTGSTGDTLDLSKLPPNIRDRARMMADKFGAEPLPDGGVMSKQAFMDWSARNSAKIQSVMGSMGGGMGGPPRFTPPGGGGPPGAAPGAPPALPPGGGAIVITQDGKGDLKVDGKDGKMEISFDQRGGMGGGKRDRMGMGGPPGGGPDMRMNMGGWGGDNGGWGGGGGGGGWGGWGNNGGENGNGGRPDNKKETEEQKPVAMRYGHLPKDLPEWFDKYDIDKDGQIALWEWRKAGEDIAKFQEMDLNGDGLITADELLRFTILKSEQARIDAINNGDGTTAVAARPTGRPGKGGGTGGGIALPGSQLPSTDKGGPAASEKGGDKPGPKGPPDKGDRPDRADRPDRPDRGNADKGGPNPFRDGGGKKGKN
jgi:hypothetical protein